MFNNYPYTDFHELNLDWILSQIRGLERSMSEFEAMNKITFDGAWDITKQYPAWCIVNDNGAGYISIQPVPAGMPLTNNDYWRGVVDYTATIADLQNRIINCENDINTINNVTIPGINNAISTVDAKYDPLINKKYVFLGDSYNFYGGGWLTSVVSAMGITDYYDYTVTGHGFTTATNWIDDLNQFITEHPDVLADITDVVIVGGVNDCYNASFTDLPTNVTNFCALVKSSIPNAKFTMCFVGNAKATSPVIDTRIYGNRVRAIGIEQRIITSNGCVFAEGCQNALYQYTLFDSDGLHPNSSGQEYGIIPAVICALTGSEFVPAYYFELGSFPDNLGLIECINNGRSVLRCGTTQIDTGITVSSSWIDVYTLPYEVSCSEHTPVVALIDVRDYGSSQSHRAYARVHDHKIQLRACETLNSYTYDTFTTNSTTYITAAVFDDDIQGSV